MSDTSIRFLAGHRNIPIASTVDTYDCNLVVRAECCKLLGPGHAGFAAAQELLILVFIYVYVAAQFAEGETTSQSGYARPNDEDNTITGGCRRQRQLSFCVAAGF